MFLTEKWKGEAMENKITLIGDVVSAPRESHKSSGKIFYKFFIGVERKAVSQIFFRYCLTKKSAIRELAEGYTSVGR